MIHQHWQNIEMSSEKCKTKSEKHLFCLSKSDLLWILMIFCFDNRDSTSSKIICICLSFFQNLKNACWQDTTGDLIYSLGPWLTPPIDHKLSYTLCPCCEFPRTKMRFLSNLQHFPLAHLFNKQDKGQSGNLWNAWLCFTCFQAQ